MNNTDAYRAACLAGFGIVQVPAFGVQTHIAEGALVEVMPRHRAESMPVYLVFMKRLHLPERVRAFMAWLENIVGPALENNKPS